ncbi:hypothetical protein SH1V18_01040 [Vallitalea longa]|uniref:SLH domain-containing protein n=1 Tax=Vallitalea longa TaxID=2936439 RepID=A0A9W5Y933_9FIRM|nr:S-layer homology domain-containing protein [Vallitalea longa]GKX27624.1 hypothetical protein SH1V18_01040 [Vallitalea longa]
MKKIITLLLAFTLVFGTCTFTYAAENDSQAKTATLVYEKAIWTDYYGDKILCKITIKGVVGHQLENNNCVYKNYDHKFLDDYSDNPELFTYDEETHEDNWNGKGDLIENGLTILPVAKGAEILIEVIDGSESIDFFPSCFPFIDDEKTVLCHGMGQCDAYSTGETVVFDTIYEGCVDQFPFNLNGKPTGIMVVDPETYPQPTQEEIDKAIADIAAEKANTENEDTDATEVTPTEATDTENTETANSETVPGLDNFTVKNEYTNETFSDVADADWFNDSVKYCYETGIMSGKGANSFDPKGSISLAEAITLAARTNNIYTGQSNGIENIGDNWYDGYVAYAIENNIIKEGQFTDYNRNITRAELAYLFAHSVASEELRAIQMYTVPDVDFDTPYSDEIFTLFNAGVVTGSDEDRTFYPNNDITRGEAATLIFRVLNPDSRVSF